MPDYRIHGRTVSAEGGFGLYRPTGMGIGFVRLDIRRLVDEMNAMPYDEAVQHVSKLGSDAIIQYTGPHIPYNICFLPEGIAGPTPVDEVKADLYNTAVFCGDVVKALKGG